MDRNDTDTSATLPILGWREWVALPDLDISHIKVKVDTGARSSSLHAFDIATFERDGRTFVRFTIHPRQRNAATSVTAEAEVLDFRRVRSSSGKTTRRIVIVTHVSIMGRTWPIELTLANRDAMGFRMLLGREAVRGRMVVDPGKSYYGGRPKRNRRKAESMPNTDVMPPSETHLPNTTAHPSQPELPEQGNS